VGSTFFRRGHGGRGVHSSRGVVTFGVGSFVLI
jgi:hypothetical protein